MSRNGDKHAVRLHDNSGPLPDQDDPTLSPIAERSHENSTVASLHSTTNMPAPKQDAVPDPQPAPSWWSWSKPEPAAPVLDSQSVRAMSDVLETAPEPSAWWTTTRSILTLGLYSGDGSPPADELTPLLSGKNPAPEPTAWFSWLWGPAAPPEDDSDDEYTNDVELFRSAKLCIESARDSCSYACKRSIHSQFMVNDSELAVAGTESEYSPVKFNPRKTPITPAELQESLFAPLISSHQSPRIGSSGSSIKSDGGREEPRGEELSESQSLVLPDIDENYRTITLLTRLRLMGQHVLFQQRSSESHIYKHSESRISNRKVHKVKRVVIIGVHGFLPTKFVKSNIGMSTGTASSIVDEATHAVQQWLTGSSGSDQDKLAGGKMYSIDTIALEGQGTIDERVETSLDLVANWLDLINECDFLFMVGHSQGALIGIKLLAKMIRSTSFRLSRTKVGVLSMAAPLNGPIKNLDTKIVTRAYTGKENDVLNEIVSLAKPDSIQSVSLHESLQVLVHNNVKITLSGSIGDQFVPLDSAVATSVYHPNIFRSVYVDKDSGIPPIVGCLWKLVLVARNVGHTEHGITEFLAGRCVGTSAENGHSKIIAEPASYATAIKQALETTDLTQQRKLLVQPAQPAENLYKLPWCIRELVEDVLQTKHITSLELVNELIHEYRKWTPTKMWRDFKQCLEALAINDADDLLV